MSNFEFSLYRSSCLNSQRYICVKIFSISISTFDAELLYDCSAAYIFRRGTIETTLIVIVTMAMKKSCYSSKGF